MKSNGLDVSVKRIRISCIKEQKEVRSEPRMVPHAHSPSTQKAESAASTDGE